MFNKILLPVDGTNYSIEAMNETKKIAEAFGSEVILLHVMETTTEDYPSNPYKFSRELVDKLKQEHRQISDRIIESYKKELDVLGERLTIIQRDGLPCTEIVSLAEEKNVDLIVMGASGTRGFLGMIGSVARKVAINSKRSVLLVKSPTENSALKEGEKINC